MSERSERTIEAREPFETRPMTNPAVNMRGSS